MTGGIREGVNMEKDGDSEEDNDEEVVKHMLALDITIIIVDTLFRPHLTIMSSIIYMYKSVHKKNPIKIGEGGKLIWGENEYVLTHTRTK
jgi:hypothetical protein